MNNATRISAHVIEVQQKQVCNKGTTKTNAFTIEE
jgi:hypothetical protein